MDKRDELLLLIAVSGELPADWVGAAVGSESYGAVLLTRLKRDGEIKLRNRDGLRGYILREKAKRYLKDKYGLAAEPFLSGSSSTNHVKSEPEKRLRLYRMSQVWIFCRRAGIGVFAGEKPELFGSGYHGANGDAATQGEWRFLLRDSRVETSHGSGDKGFQSLWAANWYLCLCSLQYHGQSDEVGGKDGTEFEKPSGDSSAAKLESSLSWSCFYGNRRGDGRTSVIQ